MTRLTDLNCLRAREVSRAILVDATGNEMLGERHGEVGRGSWKP